MANLVYNRFMYNLMKKVVDLSADEIKCALLAVGYTPNEDHNVWADVSGSEAVGAGYTAGGQALTGKTVTQDDTNDKGVFDADNVTWNACTITARYAVLYDVTAANNLICLFDFESNKSSFGGTFNIIWYIDGIILLALKV